jgi:hypothetical protein
MNRLELLQQNQEYASDINLFTEMIRYKTHLQIMLRLIMSSEDNEKLKKDIPNEGLIYKMAVIADLYHTDHSLSNSSEILYALTKSGAVILSELDLPEFKSQEGHFRFYSEYINFATRDTTFKIHCQNQLKLSAARHDI